MQMYSLKKFWPEGVSVHGIYHDHDGLQRKISLQGLGAARRGQLRTANSDALLFLLEVASDFAGRRVEVEEIIVSDNE